MLGFVNEIEKDNSNVKIKIFRKLEIAQKLHKYKHVLVAFCGFLKL